jgi:hypothetical protein
MPSYPTGFQIDPSDLPLLRGKSVHRSGRKTAPYARVNLAEGVKALVPRLILGTPPKRV